MTELQTVEIRTVLGEGEQPRISLSHYNQPQSYELRLRRIVRAALTDLLTLGERQFDISIKRLENINETIQECALNAYYEFALAPEDHPVSIEHITDVLDRYDIDVEGVIGFPYDTNRKQYTSDFVLPLIFLLNRRSEAIDSLKTRLDQLRLSVSDDFDSVFPPEADVRDTSYKWLLTTDQLKELYRMLNPVHIIDTSEEDFIAVFTRKPVGSFSPVRWRDDSASEVVFFIYQLIHKDCLSESKGSMNYQKLISCICKPDGQPFDSKSLASSKYKLDSHPTQDKKEAIQDIINQVRSPQH